MSIHTSARVFVCFLRTCVLCVYFTKFCILKTAVMILVKFSLHMDCLLFLIMKHFRANTACFDVSVNKKQHLYRRSSVVDTLFYTLPVCIFIIYAPPFVNLKRVVSSKVAAPKLGNNKTLTETGNVCVCVQGFVVHMWHTNVLVRFERDCL